MRGLGSLRDEVLARANISDCAARAGFRREGRAWLCAFHKDKNPSASIHRERIHCFTCGRSWNVIDLQMHLQGCDFVTALRTLASEYGIPWPGLDLSRAQKRELADQRERDAADINSAEFWRTALLRRTERELGIHKRLLFLAPEDDNAAGERIRALTTLNLSLRRAPRADLLAAFRGARVRDPESVETLAEIGREDDRNARETTAIIVRMLEYTEQAQERAA